MSFFRHSLATAACAAFVLLQACSKPETPPPAPMPSVHGAEVRFPQQQDPADIRLADVMPASERPLVLPGRLVWDEDRTARIYAPFSGRLERIGVQLGQTVAAGSALAQLSAADMGQAQADVWKAQADERLARQQLERAQSLLEVGAVARKDLEAAQAEAQRSQAELQRARARLQPYGVRWEAGGTQPLQQNLPLTTPVGGVLVERNASPGLEVRPDTATAPLFVVSDPTRLWALLDLDEMHLSRVQVGARMVLSTAAWPDERYEATVQHVASVVDPQSRTVKVRAQVANPKLQLRAEMFVQAQVDAHDGLPLVPADAVFVRGQQLGVFVSLGQGRFERRWVQLRTAGPQWWHVVQGLKAGEKVVVGGALFLNQMLDTAQ